MSLSNNYPTIRPTLEFDFANVGALDPRITFARATTATFVNQLGVIQTAASGVPRFDYDPSTLAARGLLIEEQRTNLFVRSEEFNNASWVTFQSATVSANAGVAPDGTTTADLLTWGTGGASGIYQSAASNAGSTFSLFAKTNSGSTSIVIADDSGSRSATFNLATGALISAVGLLSATTTSFQNGWWRLAITFDTAPSNIKFITGAGVVGSALIWGAQLENGSFPTSYIPTVASTVTRNADVATVNTLTPWYNSAEGTLFSEHDFIGFNSNTQAAAVLVTAATTNYVLIYKSPSGNNSVEINSGASTQATLTLGAATANTIYKIAGVYKVNDFAAVQNGGSVQTDTSGAIPTGIEYLGLGFVASGAPLQLNGHLRRVAYYPQRLTNAQLQALTS